MFLEDVADFFLIFLYRFSLKQCSVHPYRSFFRLFHSGKKPEKRGFSTSGFSYDPKGVYVFQFQRKIVQNLSVVILGYML